MYELLPHCTWDGDGNVTIDQKGQEAIAALCASLISLVDEYAPGQLDADLYMDASVVSDHWGK